MTPPTLHLVSLNHTVSQELQHHGCGCDGIDKMMAQTDCAGILPVGLLNYVILEKVTQLLWVSVSPAFPRV